MSTKKPEIISIPSGEFNWQELHALNDYSGYTVVYNVYVPTAQILISGNTLITSPFNDFFWDHYYKLLLEKTRRELKQELAVLVGAVRASLGLPPA